MMRHKLRKGETMWLLAVMSAPMFFLAGTADWLSVLLSAIVGTALCMLVWLVPENGIWSRKWYCAAQYTWLVIVLSFLSRWADGAWPTGNGKPAVSLTLMTLATVSAWNGKKANGQIGVLLCAAVTFLYGIVLVSGIGQWKRDGLLLSEGTPWPWLVIFLLPAAGACMLQSKNCRIFPIAGILSVVATVWTAGIAMGEQSGWKFYEASKSIRLLGIADRFESLVSVGATLGFFTLFSYLLMCVRAQARQIVPSAEKYAVIVAATIAWLTGGLWPQTDSRLLGLGTVIIWGFMPLLGLFDKKREDRPDIQKPAF